MNWFEPASKPDIAFVYGENEILVLTSYTIFWSTWKVDTVFTQRKKTYYMQLVFQHHKRSSFMI